MTPPHPPTLFQEPGVPPEGLTGRPHAATQPAPPPIDAPSFLPALEADERLSRMAFPPGAALQLLLDPSGQALVLTLEESVIFGRATHRLPATVSAAVRACLARHPALSREHLMFRRHGRHAVVIDLKSSNGTYLNGQRLEPYCEHPLADGDRLRLATLRLTVRFIDRALG